MKRLLNTKPLLSLVAAAMAASPFAVTAAEPEAEAPMLCEKTINVVKSYGKTAEPRFPDHDDELWEQIDCSISSAPGRMKLPRNIVVNKPTTRLHVMNIFGDTISTYRVCASSGRGQKSKMDDCRTPEGNFGILGVYNSTDWVYKETKSKCYGPFFIHLNTPRFYGIGIHGTNAPHSVPGRSSHGCMRMHNEDIVIVRQMVNKDSRITVLPDPVQPE